MLDVSAMPGAHRNDFGFEIAASSSSATQLSPAPSPPPSFRLICHHSTHTHTHTIQMRFPFDRRRTSIFRLVPNFFGIWNTPFDFDFACGTFARHNVPQNFKNRWRTSRARSPRTHTHTHARSRSSLFWCELLCIRGTYARAHGLSVTFRTTQINGLQQKRREKIAGKNILITAISNKRSFFSLSPCHIVSSRRVLVFHQLNTQWEEQHVRTCLLQLKHTWVMAR